MSMTSPKASSPPNDSRSRHSLESGELYQPHHLSPIPAYPSAPLSLVDALVMQARAEAPAFGSYTSTSLWTGGEVGADPSPESDRMALNAAIALIDAVTDPSGQNRHFEVLRKPAILTARHSENPPRKPADQ
jgi:hypothetical protein